MHVISSMNGYGTPHPDRPSLGVVPVVVAIAGGAAAAGAGGSYWAGSDCLEWWCWGNLKRSVEEAMFGTPTVSAPPDLSLPPAAPVTETEMTMPGAFTPEEMLARTQQAGRDVRTTAERLARRPGTVPTGDTPSPEMNILALVLLGAGALMLVRG